MKPQKPRVPYRSRLDRLRDKIDSLLAEHAACVEQRLEREGRVVLDKLCAAAKLPKIVRHALAWTYTSRWYAGEFAASEEGRTNDAGRDVALLYLHFAPAAIAETNVERREYAEQRCARHLGACAGHLFRAREIAADTPEQDETEAA